MWTTNRTLNAKLTPRPARIAYLIPESAEHNLLDRLIEESLSRWGGRRTPFIPTNGISIDSTYWTFLDYWDADIIYSYSDLSDELQDRLYYSFAPSEIIMHNEVNRTNNDKPTFQGNYQFLSSLSLLPLFDRKAQSINASLPEIVDYEIWDEDIRDLADSFGFVSRSCIGKSLHPYAKRTSFRQEGYARQFHERETTYAKDTIQWIESIAEDPTVLTLSRLADMLCPSLNFWSNYKTGWNDYLTVVIGDGTSDRILAWNAQHRYSTLNLGDDIPILRLSPKRFEAGIPDWFTKWITARNHRHLEHSNTKQVKLKSCSLSKPELDRIAELMHTNYILISTEHYENPNVFESPDLSSQSGIWFVPGVKANNIRFKNNELDVPLSAPQHIDVSKASQFFHGVWASELVIERIEDHSQSDNQHHTWTFPRRLRLETAIEFENYASEIFRRIAPVVPPPPRPNKNGSLTIWDCIDWTRPVLTLPSDYSAFCQALYKVPYTSPVMRRKLRDATNETRNTIWNRRFRGVTISDKGRDLLGVLQFFRSLPEALIYLNDRFWTQVIARLSPEEPQDKEKYIREIVHMIEASYNPESKTATDFSKIAQRALELASRSFSSQEIKTYNFESLYEQAKQLREIRQDQGNELKKYLTSAVTHLRNQEFLWQGFHWKCSFCQHGNWLSLERLTAISCCEICRKEKSSPVAGGLDLRLNPFVEHAFASGSSQGPVLWCLNQLEAFPKNWAILK